jgi:type I restriction enzyme M protein
VEKKDFLLVPSKIIEFVNRDENNYLDDKMTALKAEFADLPNADAERKKKLLKEFKELGFLIDL